ncbi:MAG: hypothetical protein H5U26_00500 [Immundisolibacter sp.]|uniref:hypothetical protein n=1 Tax=Immundisolibacter sp. TaxID=1934948 RepID=UPI0019CA7AE8|nr:hypothetical protein [Immundisolibacter sp.]MBC7160574.1 hypothetical protein [Immundisolibacter sp.]
MIAAQKKRPLIRYAGSAAETSIGSKPIGSELGVRMYSERPLCLSRAELALATTGVYLPGSRQTAAPNAPLRRAAEGMTHEQDGWPPRREQSRVVRIYDLHFALRARHANEALIPATLKRVFCGAH